MKLIPFKQFCKDYIDYYDIEDGKVSIKTETDMDEVIFNIYDTDLYEIDYEYKTIILN